MKWSLDQQKMVVGFLLVVIYAVLAGLIALGSVHKDTSYGLDFILGGLNSMTTGFTVWCFTSRNQGEDK